MTPLLFIILLAGIFAAVLLFGIYLIVKDVYSSETQNTFVAIGVIGLILVGAFGFGVYGVNKTQYEIKTEPNRIEILKSTTTLYLEIDDKKYSYDTHETYENISDSTAIFYIIEYNMYDYECEKTLYYIDKTGRSREIK